MLHENYSHSLNKFVLFLYIIDCYWYRCSFISNNCIEFIFVLWTFCFFNVTDFKHLPSHWRGWWQNEVFHFFVFNIFYFHYLQFSQYCIIITYHTFCNYFFVNINEMWSLFATRGQLILHVTVTKHFGPAIESNPGGNDIYNFGRGL